MNVNVLPYKSGRAVKNGSVASLLDDFLRIADPREIVAAPRAFPINVSEGSEGYCLEAYLPGVAKENIDISVEDGELTITVSPEESEDKVYAIREWAAPSGARTLALPKDANPEAVTAKVNGGILKLEIEKLAEKQPKKVEIQ